MAADTKPTLDYDGLRPPSPFLTERHAIWRMRLRAFVDAEIAPNLNAWSAAGTFPDGLFRKAAEAGILGMGFPERLGGTGEDIDLYHRMIFAEEFHRHGSGLVYADLATHSISLPPVIALGSPSLQDTVARPVLAGEKKIVFAVTEPSGGSDVSAFKTSAKRHDSRFVVNGAKTLSSGAARADFALTAVRTGEAGRGGLSLLLIEIDRPGVSVAPVQDLAWYNRNNASLTFENVEVPVDNLIGPENRGFVGLAAQLNIERFSGISATLSMARTAVASAIAWARERRAFEQRLIDHQVIRHKIVHMIQEINAAYAYLDMLVWRFSQGETPVADLGMLKAKATTVLEMCAGAAMQILGGHAYTGETQVERIYREARIFHVAGGSEEVLRDLVGRQLGF